MGGARDWSELEDQLEEITNSLVKMAGLDFSSPPIIRGAGPMDAVAAGLLALGEELQSSVVAREEAEKANEAKARFLANMSHELRTPLTAVLASAELLRFTALDAKQDVLVRRVLAASSMLQRLIMDVLDFAKIEAGELAIGFDPFKVADVLGRVVWQFEDVATAKGLAFLVDHGRLHEGFVFGDAQRVEQVLGNLVANAIKFTDTGSVRLITRSRVLNGVLELRFEIADTGKGMSEETQAHIFEGFVIGDSSNRRRHAGAGLGLSIVHGLVEQMDGDLTVETEVGVGSTFVLKLKFPIAATAEAPVMVHELLDPVTCRVLIVDDNQMIREVTTEMLRSQGCEVHAVSSGARALTTVAEREFDLILMDCQMPRMDGLEATRILLGRYPERGLFIVAITAHSSAQDQKMSLDAGMRHHINKPFTMDGLRSVVDMALAEKESLSSP